MPPDIHFPRFFLRWSQDFRHEQVIVTESYTPGYVHFVGSVVFGDKLIRSVCASRLRSDPWVEMDIPVREGVVFHFDEAVHNLRFWNWPEFWADVHREIINSPSTPAFAPAGNVIAFPEKVR